jgi:hypothetical protein
MYSAGRANVGGVTATLLLALPLFIVGSFGVRIVGIPFMMGALFSWKNVSPIRLFLSLFVVFGCIATIFLRITPADFPSAYDNSVWFFVQSKLVAWIFVGEALRRLFRSRFRNVAVTGTLILVFLSTPGTINFFVRNSDAGTIRTAPRDAAAVVEYLAQDASQGAVVLSEDQKVSICLLASTSLRVPYLEIFVTSFLSRNDIQQYRRELQSFWAKWSAGRFAAATAAKYRVDYVVSLSPRAGARASFSNDTYHVYPIRALVTPGSGGQATGQGSR